MKVFSAVFVEAGSQNAPEMFLEASEEELTAKVHEYACDNWDMPRDIPLDIDEINEWLCGDEKGCDEDLFVYTMWKQM